MVCSHSVLTPSDIGSIFMPGALCGFESIAVESDAVGIGRAVQFGVVLLQEFRESGEVIGLVGDGVGDGPGVVAGGIEGTGVLRGPVDVHLTEVVVDVGYFGDTLMCACVCVCVRERESLCV